MKRTLVLLVAAVTACQQSSGEDPRAGLAYGPQNKADSAAAQTIRQVQAARARERAQNAKDLVKLVVDEADVNAPEFDLTRPAASARAWIAPMSSRGREYVARYSGEEIGEKELEMISQIGGGVPTYLASAGMLSPTALGYMSFAMRNGVSVLSSVDAPLSGPVAASMSDLGSAFDEAMTIPVIGSTSPFGANNDLGERIDAGLRKFVGISERAPSYVDRPELARLIAQRDLQQQLQQNYRRDVTASGNQVQLSVTPSQPTPATPIQVHNPNSSNNPQLSFSSPGATSPGAVAALPPVFPTLNNSITDGSLGNTTFGTGTFGGTTALGAPASVGVPAALATPEPASLALLATGLSTFGARALRRRKKNRES